MPVTEKEFLEDLQTLDHKIAFVKEQSFKDAHCVQDVKDVLEKLKIKVIILPLNVYSSEIVFNIYCSIYCSIINTFLEKIIKTGKFILNHMLRFY